MTLGFYMVALGSASHTSLVEVLDELCPSSGRRKLE